MRPPSRHATTSIALALCVITLLPASQFLAADVWFEPDSDFEDDEVELEDENPCDSPDSSVEDLLLCLRSGSWEERFTAIEWLPDALTLDDDPPHPFVGSEENAYDLLIQVMHQEVDDFLARELLDMLMSEEGEAANRLFRAALAEPSINLKAKAVEWLQDEEDPAAREGLESLWRESIPGWLRPSLIAAIANQGMVEYLPEFVALVRDQDPEIRAAAIAGLGTLGREEGRRTLVRVLHEGIPSEQVLALESLFELPDTSESLSELLTATHSENAALRRAALRLGGRHLSHDIEARLLEIVDQGGDSVDISLAVRGLHESENPAVTEALVRLLHRLDLRSDEYVARQALYGIRNRGDASAARRISDLVLPGGSTLEPVLSDTLAHLLKESGKSESVVKVSACWLSSRRKIDAAEPRARRIAPAYPLQSVRCWRAPSIADLSSNGDRLVAGTLVTVEDHFERPEGRWVFIVTDDRDCWVPFSELTNAGVPPPPGATTRPPRVEFDLPIQEALSTAANVLLDGGLMEYLEPGTAVVMAAALTVDCGRNDQVDRLEAVRDTSSGSIRRAIERLRRACEPGGLPVGP